MQGGILSVVDIWDDMIDYTQKVEEARKRISIENDCIVIRHDNGKVRYMIPIDGFKNSVNALRWIRHIKYKKWCDEYMFQEVIRLAIDEAIKRGWDNELSSMD